MPVSDAGPERELPVLAPTQQGLIAPLMEANYIPRIFDGDINFVGLKKADSSKWNAIHKAADNPGSEIVHSPSSVGSLFRIAWIVGIVLGLTWIMRNGRTVITQWQQNMYRRANRRRHGIPDSDNRPFNVAYAAAALAKKEKQRIEREKAKAQIASDSRKSSTSSLRFRQPMRSAQTSSNVSNIQTQEPQGFNMYHPVNRPALPGGYPIESQEPQQTRFIQSNVGPAGERRSGYPVRLRFQGERDPAKVNGGRDVGFPSKHAPRRGVAQATSRGYKRQANDEDNWEASLDKRARMEATSHEMDVEETPAPFDSELSKGIKRDREELESTPDSGADETDESPQPRRIRQRREPVEKKEVRSEANKAHKRRHSLEESTASEGKDNADAHVSKHRRKVVLGHDTTESEAEDMKDYSEDPACIGRKVGEVWEVNGQTFKVGLDGERLRQVLVKQRRSKFPMPRDSIHSDVKADMEVFVEKWLDDKEYKDAKENLDLAWQSSPSTPTSGTMELRQSTGKRLLWDGPPKSPVKGRKSMHTAPVQNPFDLVLSNASRRASSVHTLAGHGGDNSQLRTSRSFSKWEKQDLEALSLKKMRDRMEKEKGDQKPAQSMGKRDGFPLLGDGKVNLSTVASGVASSGPTLPSATDKQTKTTVSFAPTPAITPSSAAPISSPGNIFAKPVPPSAIAAEPKPSSGTTPAVTSPFASNNVSSGAFKANAGSSSFNFGDATRPPVSAPTFTPTAPAPTLTNASPFNAPTAAPAQGSKPGPSSSMFNFGPSTAPGSTAPKTINFPPASTGLSATSITSTTGSTPTDPAKIFSFGPSLKGESVQPKAAPTPGSTSTGFNFTSPASSGSKTQKAIFGNSPKPVNEPTSFAAMPSVSATTAPPANATGVTNPTSFNFGSPFSQPTSGHFTSDKLNTTPVPPASAFAPSPAPTKPTESQSSSSFFDRLGSQPSTQSISSSPSFGGFGAQATKTDQTAVKPSFSFGAKESPEPAKSTTLNFFASPTSSGEQPKATTPIASEPQNSIFGSQANTNTSSSKSIFGAPPSTGQNPFGTPAISEPSKNAFGQPSQPVNPFGSATPSNTTFGPPSQSNLASAQSSEPKSAFGQTSETKNAFGQMSQPNQPKFTFGQPSEPKSAFTQPNPFGKLSSTESSKPSFGQASASEPTKPVFGQTSTSNTDTPKNPFEQGVAAAALGSVFGQPSGPQTSIFGQPPTSSSTASFGNTSASTSGNPLGSSESTSNSPGAGNTGFNFPSSSGGFAPSSFTGFGNVPSGNKPNAFDQPKPTDNVNFSTKPTPVFGQTSAFSSFPASTSAFGSSNTLASGPPNQSSGSTTPGNPLAQPGAPTSTTQATTPAQFGFNFNNKPS